MTDKCQRCNEQDDELRILFMSCEYEMNELNLPFIKRAADSKNRYTLVVCKRCRSDWMHFIRMWFHVKLPLDGEIGSGIYIRDYGYNREVSEEAFKKMNPDIEPTRFIDE